MNERDLRADLKRAFDEWSKDQSNWQGGWTSVSVPLSALPYLHKLWTEEDACRL